MDDGKIPNNQVQHFINWRKDSVLLGIKTEDSGSRIPLTPISGLIAVLIPTSSPKKEVVLRKQSAAAPFKLSVGQYIVLDHTVEAETMFFGIVIYFGADQIKFNASS